MDIICARTLARAVHLAALPHRIVVDPAVGNEILAHAKASAEAARSLLDDPRLSRPHDRLMASLIEDERFSLIHGDGTDVAPKPLGLLVGSAGNRRRGRDLSCAVWSGDLPSGALWELPDLGSAHLRVFCASPALHLLLRCRDLGLHGTALLAMDLCGIGPHHRRPITTLDELRRVVSTLPRGHRWRAMTLDALGLAMAGSLSPRESALALMLSIDGRQGGFGLPRPLLNHPLDVPPSCRGLLRGQRQIRFDLLWPTAGVAVEYDSAAHHDDGTSYERDRNRALVARTMGIEYLSVGPQAVSSLRNLEPFVRALSLAIRGREPWGVSPRTLERRKRLRAQLFCSRTIW